MPASNGGKSSSSHSSSGWEQVVSRADTREGNRVGGGLHCSIVSLGRVFTGNLLSVLYQCPAQEVVCVQI